ncbi:MAG: penicillin-binding protein [Lachnospiraceae bacterium]|nr:penicillin-binding protein [Lachnospiraceae bacterium]
MKLPSLKSRPVILAILSVAAAFILICRLFSLQIIHGAQYTESFEESVTRRVSMPARRGRILDRNGTVLADTQASSTVTIIDNTGNTNEENDRLNSIIDQTLQILYENGDSPVEDFGIRWNGSGYEFTKEGTEQVRFLADMYGYADPASMTPEEADSSAEDIVLMLADRYRIEKDMTSSMRSQRLLQTVKIRYQLSLNAFQKYVPTTIAQNVSRNTVSAILDAGNLDGVNIASSYDRVYYDSPYFSGITGYIGQITSEELEEHGDEYEAGDAIGKVGIEASMEETLRGESGYREISVDNMGREKAELSLQRATDGSDVYLTIDSTLQKNAYKILEKNIRDLILSKMTDSISSFTITEDTDGSEIRIPAADVYASLLAYIIDRDHFYSDSASEAELEMKEIMAGYLDDVKTQIREDLESGETAYQDLSQEYKDYATYIIRALYDRGALDSDKVDSDDEIYQAWTVSGSCSMRAFLYHAAEEGWIDTEEVGSGSDDAEQVYSALIEYCLDEPCEDYSFGDIVCKYVCESGEASGELVCRILFDQDLFDPSESERSNIENGRYRAAYDYVRRLIANGSLTPGQLHLYPFSGSIVITDPSDGSVLALVSYPGYDCNQLQDSDYMSQIVRDPSRPMLNHATQQRTAPGSTFKMVTALAGISEGVIDTQETVDCYDRFDKIDPSPACWIYPSGHGWQNMQNAIANSCNTYFYEIGYRLGQPGREEGNEDFDNEYGVEKLAVYAAKYGLDRASGVEIEEAEPSVATRDVVRAAIGQSNNGYTTASLARYIGAVANEGQVYDLTLIDHTADTEGTLLESYSPKEAESIQADEAYWESIREGMKRVCRSLSGFSSLSRTLEDGSTEYLEAAGKTGTAQQGTNMPNHALFLGYAPVEEPEIAIAVRIPNGYSSKYAALVASQIMQYYFDESTLSSILTGSESMPNYENGD